MKPQEFRYLRPRSLDEALQMLRASPEDVRPIAGGQSLVPMMSLRLAAPGTLLDLGGIGSLRGIRLEQDGTLVAGAMTTHSDFEHSELVRSKFPLLSAAMEGVAHMPIRSRGTIGGSLAHADPAGDWPALCVACDAQLVLSKLGSSRTVRAEDFACGIFSTNLEPGELVTEVRFAPWPERRRWGHQKMTRRRGDFAIAGAVVLLDVDAGGCIECARIVIFGATEMPVVVYEAAAHLVGSVPSVQHVEGILDVVTEAVEVRSDLHASAEYRRDLVRVMTRRAILQALPELRGNHG
ncbi:xanthine dehydrogenase family protein subunit M [uncultured Pigmentiphaga sp.]|uniref:FAD binding domain-containing protein n=1 Tax=uncultured Pigmentiphaga sp. TaxID=340361 RepID=UPI0026226716|nr:xanthine dehydrogenase family protein subunit M [uncultured Pigmentiphaga sp.]